MEITMETFLPKYPNIYGNSNDLYNLFPQGFNKSIQHKKEFYENKLKFNEAFPEKGDYFNHQKLITRFLAPHTLYDSLLIMHEMGCGKTCTAIAAVEENIKNSKVRPYKGTLYLAKGEVLINNFIEELIFKCTDGKYIPENYEKLTELEKIHRKKKAIKDYYSMNTFETFAKSIKRMSVEGIQKKYNNHIIIIDEVHNLRIQTKESELEMYEQFHKFLHTVKDCKIILMSGTPMKDGIEEVASVMNLILPLDEQFPTGDDFVETYFDNEGNFLPQKIVEFKHKVKGKVSYLKSMVSTTKIIYEGEHEGSLKYFNVVNDYMSDFQSKYYTEAYNADTTEKKGVFNESRQAILFVFPDGSYGENGFNKYIVKSKKSSLFAKKDNLVRYTLHKDLKDALSGKNRDEKLEKLSKYSSKYAASIRNIFDAIENGKSTFIYNEFVQGSGLILFGLLLEHFGFTKATGNETTKGLRYASLTNKTSTSASIKRLIDRFNQIDNARGEIIPLIIGSRKITEGFSFKNIQMEEIHTPWFNYSEIAQAIARGIRVGSHKDLIELGVIPSVSIYQRVSMPTTDINSIDLDMYQLSENKDVSIKIVERALKEAAWDCSLTYNRNYRSGYDNLRECDYMSCDYKCDNIDVLDINEDDLDYNTYMLYYNSKNIDNIIAKIIELFSKNFIINIQNIYDSIKDTKRVDIITALDHIISKNVLIINKYGLPSYLKEDNDNYYLIDSLSVKGDKFSSFYTKFPSISNHKNIRQIKEELYFKELPVEIEKICNETDPEIIGKKIKLLNPLIIEEFIENSILLSLKDTTPNLHRDIVLDIFSVYIAEINGTWYSWFLKDNTRCLKGNKWESCDYDVVDKYLIQKQKDVEKNPYGFYGLLNPINGTFCIRDVSKPQEEKKHLRTSGKVCTTWNKNDLIYMIVKFGIDIPTIEEANVIYKTSKFIGNLTKYLDTYDTINSDEEYKKIYNKHKDNIKLSKTPTKPEKKRIIYWFKQMREPLCDILEKWFRDNNLLIEDVGCGTINKKKI